MARFRHLRRAVPAARASTLRVALPVALLAPSANMLPQMAHRNVTTARLARCIFFLRFHLLYEVYRY